MKAVYQSLDCGTERMVRLIDESTGNDIVPPRDPFWPVGIPVSNSARARRIKTVAREMAVEARSQEKQKKQKKEAAQ